MVDALGPTAAPAAAEAAISEGAALTGMPALALDHHTPKMNMMVAD